MKSEYSGNCATKTEVQISKMKPGTLFWGASKDRIWMKLGESNLVALVYSEGGFRCDLGEVGSYFNYETREPLRPNEFVKLIQE